MLIERPPEWFRSLFPGVVFRLPASDSQKRLKDECKFPTESGPSAGDVYLTFDDGPIPEVTPWVLDVLDKFGIKATFFMVGQNIERHPELLEEVRRRGHSVGNHSLHHIRGLLIKPEDYLRDVDACEVMTGSGLFRPPHGYLTPGQLKALKRRYRVVMHDLVTRDYSRRLTPGEVVDNVKRYVRDGSVIVFHDSLKSWPRLREALPQSLEYLMARGFRLLPLGKDL